MKLNRPKIINIPNEKTRELEKNVVQIKFLIEDYNNKGKNKAILGVWHSNNTPIAELSAVATYEGKLQFGTIQDVDYILEETYQANKDKYAETCYLEDLDLPADHVLTQLIKARENGEV